MLSGTVPFKGNNINELNTYIQKGKFKEIKDISNDAKNLISCLLEIDPKKRITINKILNHSWIKNTEYKQKSKGNDT
jgi:serine/threonine protein kinase